MIRLCLWRIALRPISMCLSKRFSSIHGASDSSRLTNWRAHPVSANLSMSQQAEDLSVITSDIRSIYSWAWAFAFACPVLFFIPVLVEFAQHFVEMEGGMYSNPAGAKGFADDPLRMQFGFAKVIALLLPGYWFTRFVLFGNDAAAARRAEWPAVGLWSVIFLLGTGQAFWSLFGSPWSQLLGVNDKAMAGAINTSVGLIGSVLGIYLMAWGVAWAVANAAIGPLQSIRLMHGSFWRTVVLMIAGVLPLMAVHYALAYAAINFGPATFDWTLLIVDSVVTGFLALTMTGSTVAAVRHAAEKSGLSLLPNSHNG